MARSAAVKRAPARSAAEKTCPKPKLAQAIETSETKTDTKTKMLSIYFILLRQLEMQQEIVVQHVMKIGTLR